VVVAVSLFEASRFGIAAARKRQRAGDALIRSLLTIFIVPGLAFAQTGSGPSPEQNNRLVLRIWNGVQEAQKKYLTGCGVITEKRTSKLLVKPLIFRGKFCASGMTKFSLEYSEPEPIRVRFNGDYVNVSTGPGARNTEVIKVGHHVRRTQAYFSRDKSIENLRKNFVIAARDAGSVYEMKLVPRSERFRRRVNYVIVRLGKDDFLLRSLEIDGKSGVHSLFTIQITALNLKINDDMFKVYRP
jgi:hypothetical protein